jgi:MoaA/NifB/PqqE/SkfB family radical SAM enzyme
MARWSPRGSFSISFQFADDEPVLHADWANCAKCRAAHVPLGRRKVIVDATTIELSNEKFRHAEVTADGSSRAKVDLTALRTLWFNTGTLCNLTCRNCYMESSPRNDSLAYLSLDGVRRFLDEIHDSRLPTEEIGFTGGEPFMNPDFIEILELCLRRRFRVLVLTNAMRPMMKLASPLLDLRQRFGGALVLRVSLDHYAPARHETERGARSWQPTIDGLRWLAANDFTVNIAGRTCWDEPEDEMRAGYAGLFADIGLAIDANDPVHLVLFPEMDARADVPEITEQCWSILGVSPEAMMCASARMVVKRKGDDRAIVVPCTLLPYDAEFEMGAHLAEAAVSVSLNHPHCARFCVLGGGACSQG